jgi:hypothetical protein
MQCSDSTAPVHVAGRRRAYQDSRSGVALALDATLRPNCDAVPRAPTAPNTNTYQAADAPFATDAANSERFTLQTKRRVAAPSSKPWGDRFLGSGKTRVDLTPRPALGDENARGPSRKHNPTDHFSIPTHIYAERPRTANARLVPQDSGIFEPPPSGYNWSICNRTTSRARQERPRDNLRAQAAPLPGAQDSTQRQRTGPSWTPMSARSIVDRPSWRF